MQLKLGDKFSRLGGNVITLVNELEMYGVRFWIYERKNGIRSSVSVEDLNTRVRTGLWKKIEPTTLLEFKRKCT